MQSSVSQGRVLVVDDGDVSRRIIAELLERAGFTVTVTTTVAGGLAAYRELAPDCAVVDLVLPDGDGHRVVAAIREHDHAAQIVLMSALADALQAARRDGCQADDFLGKPFDPSDLVFRVLKRVVSRQRGRPQVPSPESRVVGPAKADLVPARVPTTQDSERRTQDSLMAEASRVLARRLDQLRQARELRTG